MMKTYLALGDSYTIGEQVPLGECFPYQTVQLLRINGLKITSPEIIAKTGWTTDELLLEIKKTSLLPKYDFVSLLIGVNNQYRGMNINTFKAEFYELLENAVTLAGNKEKNVFLLSIPDWGLTPFAEGRDQKKISGEIDAYNDVCKTIAERNNCHYLDITFSQREDVTRPEFLAADKLHPSGKEYAKWAEKLAVAMSLAIENR